MITSDTCIIVGSGASIRSGKWNTEAKNLILWQKLKKYTTFGINWAYKYHVPTVELFVDPHFWNTEKEGLQYMPLCISTQVTDYGRVFKKKYKEMTRLDDNIFLVPASSKYHELPERWGKGFYSRKLSGMIALSLAITFGFKNIYLLGYDCQAIEGRTHFYQDEEDVGIVTHFSGKTTTGVGFNDKGNYNTSLYQTDKINNLYACYLPELEKCNIYNVSLNSKIDIFPKISYEEFYKHLEQTEKVNQDEIRRQIKAILVSHYETKKMS